MKRSEMIEIIDNFCDGSDNGISCKKCPIRKYKCYAPRFCRKKELKEMVKNIKKFEKKRGIK